MSQDIPIQDWLGNDPRKRQIKCFNCQYRSPKNWRCRINVVSRLNEDLTSCPTFKEREKK